MKNLTGKHRLNSVCVLVLAAAFLAPSVACADLVTLADTTDDGGFAPSTNGVSIFSFEFGKGWTISNDSEGDVVSMIESSPVVVDAASVDLRMTHSYDFEYSLGSELPDSDGDAYDGGNLQISVNGGGFTNFTNWTSGGYTPDFDGVDGLNQEEGWSYVAVDEVSTGTVSGLAPGDTLMFRLVAGWDDSRWETAVSWTISEFSVEGIAAIPEPSIPLMLTCVGMGFAVRRRR